MIKPCFDQQGEGEVGDIKCIMYITRYSKLIHLIYTAPHLHYHHAIIPLSSDSLCHCHCLRHFLLEQFIFVFFGRCRGPGPLQLLHLMEPLLTTISLLCIVRVA